MGRRSRARDGAPVLLIHGLGYDARRLGAAAASGSPGATGVLSFDNRGIGESEIPPGPYTVEELAEDAVAVLDDGGGRAGARARREPRRVRRAGARARRARSASTGSCSHAPRPAAPTAYPLPAAGR